MNQPSRRLRRLLAAAVALLFSANTSFASYLPVTVEESDGSPSVKEIATLKVSNGTLTDNGNGVVTIVNSGGSGTVNTGAAGYFTYYPGAGTTVDDQAVLYTDGTNVGIGNASPRALLELTGDLLLTAGADRTISVFRNVGANPGNDLNILAGSASASLGTNGGNLVLAGGAERPSGGSPGNTLLAWDPVGAAPRGNVGIGTTVPAAPLDVRGAFTAADADNNGIYSVATQGAANASNITAGVKGRVDTTATAITLGTAASLYAANPSKGAGSTITNAVGLYIENITAGQSVNNWSIYSVGGFNYFGGRVGIGSTSPVELLDIAGPMKIAQASAPGTTTDKLYNVSGSLYWNGTNISSGSSPTMQTTYGNDADGSDAIIALTTADDSLIFRNPAASGTDSAYLTLFDQLNTGAKDAVMINQAGTGYALRVNDDGTSTDSTPFVITNGGYVGIGTTSPSTLLSVRNDVDNAVMTSVVNGTSGAWANAGFSVSVTGAGGDLRAYDSAYTLLGSHFADRFRLSSDANTSGLDLEAGAAAADMRFFTGGTATTNERVRINTAGNVGIGSDAPTGKLDVNPATFTPAAAANARIASFTGAITEAGSGTHARLMGVEITPPTITGGAATVTDTASLYISAEPSATVVGQNYALWVDSGISRLDGNVGINESAPVARLHVSEATTAGNAIFDLLHLEHWDLEGDPANGIGTSMSFNASPSTGAVAQTASISSWFSDVTSSSKDGVLAFSVTGPDASGTTATEKMRILSNGNVGIGSTSPAELLDVAGRVKLAQVSAPGTTTDKLYNVSGSLYWNGTNISSGSTPSLQTVYGNDANGSDTIISLTASDDSLIFRNPASSGTDSAYLALFDQLNTGSKDAVMINQAGTGYALRVNDDGTSTDTTAFIIDQNGNVGIGTTSSWTRFLVHGDDTDTSMSVMNSSSTSARYPGIVVLNYGGSSGGAPVITLENHRGSTASPAAILSGDSLGSIGAWGQYDTTLGNIGKGAMITFAASGNFSSSSHPTTMGFFTTDTNATSPSERMTIRYDGNVGIGSTAPEEKLDINGVMKLGQTSAPGIATDKLYNVSGNLYWDGGFILGSDSASPGLKTLRAGNATSSGSSGGSLSIESGTSMGTNIAGSGLAFSSGVATGNAASGPIYFLTSDVGSSGATLQDSTAKVTILGNGNVGIGSTSPAELLDVAGPMKIAQASAPGVTTDKLYNVSGSLYWNGTNISSGGTPTMQSVYGNDADGSDSIVALTTADDSLIFRNPASSGTDSGYLALFEQLNTGAVDGVTITQEGTGSAFRVNDVASDTTPFIIAADGNVGIGTTSATSELTLYGANKAFRIIGSNILTLADGSTPYIGTSSSAPLALGTATGTTITLDTAGNAGIGSTAPTGRLDVNAGTFTPTAAANARIVNIGGAITEAGSGTHARLMGVEITPPTITGAAATVTDTASLYVSNEPTATVSGQNYALWVDAGKARFDGNVGVGSSTPSAILDALHTSTSTTGATEIGQKLYLSDTGVVSTGTDTTTGVAISATRTGASGGTINSTGLSITGTGDAGGTSTMTGLNVSVSGADTNYAATFSGGNVGIGTTAPSEAFVIDQNTPVIYMNNDGGGANDYPRIKWNATTGSEGLKFYVGAAEVARIQDNGELRATRWSTLGGFYLLDYAIQRGTTDAGVSFPGSNVLTFGSGALTTSVFATEYARFNGSGNLGIGSASPAEKLDVNGAVKLAQVSAPGVTTDKLYNVGGTLTWNGTALGSSSPTLQNVYTNDASGDADVTTTNAKDISITLADTTTDANFEITTAGTGSFIFNDDGTFTDSTAFSINGSGDVNVGNNVSVNGGAIYHNFDGPATIRNNSTNSAAAMNLIGGAYAGSSLQLQSTSASGSGDYISLKVGNNGGTEAMRAISNGNVGIGSTAPANKLDVVGAIDATTVYKLDNTTVLSNGGTENLFVGIDATPTGLTTGLSNTTLGYGAGNSIVDSNTNTFIGRMAGYQMEAGGQNTFIGASAGRESNAGGANIFIGSDAGVNNQGANNIIIGNSAAGGGTSDYNVVIGLGSGSNLAGGAQNVILGAAAGQTLTEGGRNVILGRSSDVSTNSINDAIVLGYDSTATASNQMVVGSDTETGYINDIYLGNGVTNATPSSVAVNASGGSGSDNAGANLTLAGGKGTGNAAGGDIIFQTSDAGSSGATLQSLTTKMILTELGNVGIGSATPAEKLDVNGAVKLAQASAPGVTTDKLYNVSGSLYWNGTNISSGGTPTMQSVYGNDADGSDTTISLTSADDSLIFTNPSSSGTDSTYLATFSQLNTGAKDGVIITQAGTGYALRVNDDGSATDSSPVVINQSGNVGIGTTTASELFEVYGGGASIFKVSTTGPDIYMNAPNSTAYMGYVSAGNWLRVPTIYSTATTLTVQGGLTTSAGDGLAIGNQNSSAAGTSGTQNLIKVATPWQPTSGTGVWNDLQLSSTINQTGGANGVSRGLYVNPTLTAAADYRAIETVRGNVILGSTSGNVGIGTTSPSAPLHVAVADAATNTSVDVLRLNHSTSGTAAANFGTGILFTGEDGSGTAEQNMARIYTTWEDAGTGGHAQLVFAIANNGSLAGAMMIDQYTNVYFPQGARINAYGDMEASDQGNVYAGGFATSSGNDPTDNAFAFKGNTDTGIYEPNLDQIGFSTAGTEKVRITEDGNLGIGSLFPAEKLDVNGAVKLAQVSAPGVTTDKLYNVGGTLTWNGTALGSGGSPALNAITAAAGNSGAITHGNYAIDWQWNSNTTTNPFSLSSSSLTSGSLLNLAVTGSAGITGQKGLNISTSGAVTGAQTTYGAYIANTHTGGSTTNVGLYASASGSSAYNYAAIFDQGNVAIGTTFPTRTLDIVSNVTHSPAGTASQISIRGTGTNLQKLNIGYDTTDHYGFIESVAEGSAWQNLALQPSGGNVGIGTTNPGGALDIASGSAYIRTGGALFSDTIYNYGNSTTLTLNSQNAGYLFSSSSGNLVSILTGGNVGIGSTVPAEKLDVNGAVKLAQVSAPGVTTDKLYNVGGTLTWNGTALGAGGASSLQGAYDGDANGSDSIIALTANDDSLIFRNPASSGSDTTNVLTVEQLATGAVDNLILTHAGTGYALRVNDDGTSTDSSPFIIAADGNVGIGTASAAQKLFVGGAVGIPGTNGYWIGSSRVAYQDGTAVYLGAIDDAVDLRIRAGSNDRMTILAGGNVGIGSTAPTSPLNVNGATYTAAVGANAGIVGIGGAITEASSGTHALLTGVAIVPPTITGGSATVTDTASLYVSNEPTATVAGQNYALWVDAGKTRFDGSVAVGAASTSASLGVTRSITDSGTDEYAGNFTLSHLSGANAGSDTGLTVSVTRTGVSSGDQDNTGLLVNVTGDTGGNSVNKGLDVTVSGADTNYAALFNGGNVGIGTTTASKQLHVYGSINNPSSLATRVDNAGTGYSENQFYTTSDDWTIGVGGSGTGGDAGDFYIYNATDTQNRLVLDAAGANYFENGNLGIGSTVPAEKLDVNGAVKLAQVSAPGVTTDKLYNVGGTLTWNGTSISGGSSKWTDAGAYTYLTASGDNVGIGTTTVNNKLVVKAGAIGDGFAVDGAASGTISPQFSLSIDGTQRAAFGIATANTHYSGLATTGDAVLRALGGTGDLILANEESGDILFTTGTTTSDDTLKMLIKNGGNIGVGDSPNSPSAGLHVIQADAADAFRVDDVASDTSPFIIDQNGNVGVGTTSAGNQLHMYGTNPILRFTNSSGNGAINIAVGPTYSGTGSNDFLSFNFPAGSNNRTGVGSVFMPFSIMTTGLLVAGINFDSYGSSAGYSFGTYGLNTPNVMSITNNATAAVGIESNFLFDAYRTTSGATTYAKIGMVTTNVDNTGYKGDLVFSTANAAAAAERVRIQSDGNVGIGTTAPNLARMQVASANTITDAYGNLLVHTTDAAAINKGGYITLGGLWDGSSSPTAYAGIAGRKEDNTSGNAGGYMALSTSTVSGGVLAEHVRISGDGNVGIGTTTMSEGKLRVVGQMSSKLYTITYAGTINVDWNNGNTQTVTLTGNPTINFAGGVAGGKYTLILKQDGTGSRTVTWGTGGIRWAAATAPTLTTTLNKTDYIGFIYDGTNYDGIAVSKNF